MGTYIIKRDRYFASSPYSLSGFLPNGCARAKSLIVRRRTLLHIIYGNDIAAQSVRSGANARRRSNGGTNKAVHGENCKKVRFRDQKAKVEPRREAPNDLQ